MHELSIAQSIVSIAESEAAKAKTTTIRRIELEIGTLAGIELDALNFVWPAAVKGTLLENAIKSITIIEARACCNTCQNIFILEQLYDPCPECSGYHKQLLEGKDLKIKSLELESP